MSKILTWKVFNLSVPDAPVENTEVDFVYDTYQTFGSDNLFPQHLAAINRQSPVHAGVLANKVLYGMGSGLEISNKKLTAPNPDETFIGMLKKYLSDQLGFGNGTLEVVTDKRNSFVSIYHKDFTKCRISKDGKSVIQHPKWEDFASTTSYGVWIPLFPEFDVARDANGKEIASGAGYLRSIYHRKDYSPEFQYYGLPSWISALAAAGISYKTNKWNLSRLDNSFKGSGVMMINGDIGEDESKKMTDEFTTKMTGEGTTGKILFIIRELGQDATVQFTPIDTKDDGDWMNLHKQAESDIITAHNWFRSLSGIADNTGFDTKRILNEYQVAQNTVIRDMQVMMADTLTAIYQRFKVDTGEITFINKPPVSTLTLISPEKYIHIWEARKMAGMDYDENDPEQQKFINNGTNDTRRSSDRSD